MPPWAPPPTDGTPLPPQWPDDTSLPPQWPDLSHSQGSTSTKPCARVALQTPLECSDLRGLFHPRVTRSSQQRLGGVGGEDWPGRAERLWNREAWAVSCTIIPRPHRERVIPLSLHFSSVKWETEKSQAYGFHQVREDYARAHG